MADDPYVDPASGLLRNLLGITDPAELAAAEADFTRIRIHELVRHPVPGRFDLAHLQDIHRHITQDLVAWAGQLRTVDIAKTNRFCPVQNLTVYAEDIFGRLARQNFLRGLDRDAFVNSFSGFYGDVNALHPFREFNGRAQRAFFGQLASQAGWDVFWDRMDATRNVAASIASFNGDEAPLRELLDELVQP